MKIETLIKDLVEEWDQNLRVRYGVIAILLIISLWLILSLQDLVSAKKVELDNATQDYRDIQLIESESFWLEQLEAEKVLESKIKKMFWRVPSESRAKVYAQSRLLEVANALGITRTQIKVGEPQEVEALPGYFRLQLSFVGFFRGRQFFDFISEMESGTPEFFFESLRIATSSDAKKEGRLEFIVSVIFMKGN